MKKLFLAALLLACTAAHAQQGWPNKPVKLVVSFAAGGISDVLARALAIPLSKQLGQQVIVENKPGAGTTIAGDYIARAAPDGYNIWLQDITTHAINVALYSKLPYDSVQDFTFIAMVASTPLMLVVHPSMPAKSVPELVGLLKASPGKYSYGSSGNGTIVHLAAEMLRSAAGVEVLHVP
jgi:tripartite-type tricarboxylate transporter receptor subunit TctC